MLVAKPTRYGAGATIYGDYYDLRGLHETIHSLVRDAPIKEVTSEFVLGLAYDLRHAYQGDRETEAFGVDELDTVKYAGVRVLWPILIPQVALLRWSASFAPTTKADQANLYRLEYCAESSLSEYDPKTGALCVELFSLFHGLPEDYLFEFVTECARRYIVEGPAGKSRFRRLPTILRMLAPMSSEYRDFRDRIMRIASEKGCNAHELQAKDDWPAFRW